MDDTSFSDIPAASPSPGGIFRFFAHYPYYILAAGAFLLIIASVWIMLSAPRLFPAPTAVTIERGSSLIAMSAKLKALHIIRSETLFQAFAILFSGDRSLPAGTYAFEERVPVYEVAWRIANGEYGISRKKITIPEGATVRDIGLIAEKMLIGFDRTKFSELAEDKEGYLFPDTYYFFSDVTPEELISVMEKNFSARIAPIVDSIAASKRPLKDLIVMASLLELEANKSEDRRIVSGILWKRLDEGMRLQVDAPFFYLRQGSAEREVTREDLAVDSPYNTYRNDGLPPGPIGNPGLDAIIAALRPEPSAYWYYLYDASGTIHYARTFAEHKANKERYLWK